MIGEDLGDVHPKDSLGDVREGEGGARRGDADVSMDVATRQTLRGPISTILRLPGPLTTMTYLVFARFQSGNGLLRQGKLGKRVGAVLGEGERLWRGGDKVWAEFGRVCVIGDGESRHGGEKGGKKTHSFRGKASKCRCMQHYSRSSRSRPASPVKKEDGGVGADAARSSMVVVREEERRRRRAMTQKRSWEMVRMTMPV